MTEFEDEDWFIIEKILKNFLIYDESLEYNFNYVIYLLFDSRNFELFDKYYRYEDAIYNGKLIYGPYHVIIDVIESYNFSFTIPTPNNYYEGLEEYIKVIIKDEKSHLLVIKYMKKYNMDYKRWFKCLMEE